MRSHLACLSLLVIFPAGASATLLAWSKAFEPGSSPLAVRSGGADVFTATRTASGIWLSRVDSVSGDLNWTRPAGAGQFVGLAADSAGRVVVVTNELTGGRLQAVVRTFNGATCIEGWTWRGANLEATTLQVADRVYIGGATSGRASLAILDGALGTPLALRTLPGEQVVAMEGRRGLSSSFGWVAFASRDQNRVHVGRFSANGTLGFATEWNPLPGATWGKVVLRQPNWDTIWIAGEVNANILAARFDANAGVPISDDRYVASTQEAILDAMADVSSLRLLARSTDSLGRLRTFELSFGQGAPSVRATRVVASHLTPGGVVGRAFLAGRGWDVATESPSGVLAFESAPGADDDVVDVGVWGDVFAFVASQRLGRSQAHLMRLQSTAFLDRARQLGRGSEIALRLSGPAPRGGYLLRLSVPVSAPIRLPSTVSVAGGDSEFVLAADRAAIVEPVTIPVLITGQGRTWTELLRLEPSRVRRLQVAPSRAVGCTTLRGLVALDGPAPRGGYRIRFRSSDSSLETPRDVVVDEGNWMAEFEVCTFAVRFDTTAQLDAFTPHGAVRVPVTILRPELSSLRFEGPTVRSGSSICAIARTTGPAPLGGLDIAVTCTGALRNPGGARMPAGCNEQQIPITALPVTAPTRSTATVKLNGRFLTASVMVVP